MFAAESCVWARPPAGVFSADDGVHKSYRYQDDDWVLYKLNSTMILYIILKIVRGCSKISSDSLYSLLILLKIGKISGG